MKITIKIDRDTDLKMLVSILIPDIDIDIIWTCSARSLLEGTLAYCIATNQESISYIDTMTKWEYSKLKEELTGIEGAETALQYLSASENQVANYMSNFASKVQSIINHERG